MREVKDKGNLPKMSQAEGKANRNRLTMRANTMNMVIAVLA